MWFKTTIDSVVGDIGKKISQLRVLAGEHHDRHLLHEEAVAINTELSALELAAKNRALKIADNFENLLK